MNNARRTIKIEYPVQGIDVCAYPRFIGLFREINLTEAGKPDIDLFVFSWVDISFKKPLKWNRCEITERRPGCYSEKLLNRTLHNYVRTAAPSAGRRVAASDEASDDCSLPRQACCRTPFRAEPP
jgi:hypothetical protein